MSKSIKWVIGLATAFIICIIISVVLFFSTISGSDIKDDILNNKGTIISEDRIIEIDEEKQLSLEEAADLIEIDIDSGDVKIIESEDESFKARMKGKLVDLSLKPGDFKFNLIKEGRTVKFKTTQGWTFFGLENYFVGDITLQVPISFKGSLNIKIGSGNVKILTENEFNNFKLKVYSGRVDINNVKCKQSIIEVSSGTVNIGELKAEDINLDVSSGKITINNCEASGVTLDISSGSVNLLNGNFKTLDAEVSSGIVNVEANEVKGNYNIEISSGTFKLKLPEVASYKLSGDISSGSLKNNKTGNRYTKDFTDGSGEFAIRFDISSGYAEIN